MTESNHEDREYNVIGVYKTKQLAMLALQELNYDDCELELGCEKEEEVFFQSGQTYVGFKYCPFS